MVSFIVVYSVNSGILVSKWPIPYFSRYTHEYIERCAHYWYLLPASLHFLATRKTMRLQYTTEKQQIEMGFVGQEPLKTHVASLFLFAHPGRIRCIMLRIRKVTLFSCRSHLKKNSLLLLFFRSFHLKRKRMTRLVPKNNVCFITFGYLWRPNTIDTHLFILLLISRVRVSACLWQ